jgi:hypothetical protein
MKKFVPVLMLVAFCGAMTAADAVAAEKKKKAGSRSDYTAEQQKKIHEYALAQCRKKYGPILERVSVDYYRKRYVCYIH